MKLAFYADDLHTKPAEVACTTNGVSVSGNEITVSGDSALARIDQGTFTLDLTYDLGRYMTSIGKTEIPNVGTICTPRHGRKARSVEREAISASRSMTAVTARPASI